MAEKSALRLIPGKDALLQYSPAVYAPTTYVEYQGSVYKSLVTTSPTFVPTEWELISDPRTPRVPNIASRNALTGSTPTSGTTGINIPILDNTDVLVLNAFADPQVAANKFAIYNYNKGLNTFLLLQISTGSTSSNVSNYNLLTNKPPIISGITASAGAGLTGGGVFSGGVPPTRATFTFSHADTSSQASINATGVTYVQKLKLDTYGHVTGATTSTWVHPDTSSQPSVNGTGFTYIQSIGLDTDGHLTSIGQSTWVHPDTSSQGNVINTGSTVIQSITLDTDGHVTGINSATVSTGGGGVNFNAAGNSGGSFAMPNGGTLQITGGTNISTLSSLNGGNLGIRVNVVPAGSNNQLQINNAGALGTSANLTFTGGTTLVTNKLSLTGSPVSGLTTDEFITRNPISGAIRKLNLTTFEGAMIGKPVNSIQFNGLGLFSGSSVFLYNPNRQSLTLGLRFFAEGQYSTALGVGVVATGFSSFAQGNSVKAYGDYSHAEGVNSIASGMYSHAEGGTTQATNIGAHSEGAQTIASGANSHAEGLLTVASGSSSHSGGYSGNAPVVAGGFSSFNHSFNNNLQTYGFGALASQSAILGGLNHNIAVGNTNAAIIGGNLIRLTGTTYINTTAVGNLAIMTTPANGTASNNVLVRDTNGVIKQVTQASLSGGGGGTPAGSNGYVQLRNSVGGFGATANLFFLTGTSTLTTSNLNLGALPASGSTNNILLTRNPTTGNVERLAISALAGQPINSIQYNNGVGFGGNAQWTFDPPSKSITLGTRGVGVLGTNTVSFGTNNIIPINGGFAVGDSNNLTGALRYNAVFGEQNTVNGSAFDNLVAGYNNTVTSIGGAPSGNIAVGYNIITTGFTNAIFGYQHNVNTNYSLVAGNNNNTIIGADASVVIGSFNRARGAQSFAGGNNTDASHRNVAGGISSFSFQSTDANLPFYPNGEGGAKAQYSTVLGGINNNIDASNTHAVVLGGVGIQIPAGGAYSGYTTVNELAIWHTPTAGIGSDNTLVWNSADKKVKIVTQASVAAPANSIQFNNGAGGFGGNAQWLFSTGSVALTLGTRAVGTVGTNSIAAGTNNLASGAQSVTFGINLTASNVQSAAFGSTNVASGQFSFVCGNNSFATGFSSHAEGFQTKAIGQSSHAEGNTTTASGSFGSHAEGNGTVASGQTSHAEGSFNVAGGQVSHAEGNGTTASGSYSHAQGQTTTASGSWSHSQGQGTIASASWSHAEGNNTIASGQTSHAEGQASRAGNTASHAEGQSTKAFGQNSHAEGNNTSAYGQYGHSEGVLTSASGFASHAQGSATIASNQYTHSAGGSTGGAGKEIRATGIGAFIHSVNDPSQTAGFGAQASYSAILGGLDHNIDSSNVGAAIIGGQAINLPAGGSYSNYVAVPSLAIFTTPTTAVGGDLVLAWNSTSKKVELGTISSTSDSRLKTDIKPLINVLEKIDRLDTYEFKYNSVIKEREGTENYGLTAQQVEEIFPHVVKDNFAWNDEAYKTVDYRHLVPVLFAAIKELNEKIKDLESKVK